MTKFLAFLSDEGGASAAEYALILAIVGTGIGLSAITLGAAIGGSVAAAAECMDNKTC